MVDLTRDQHGRVRARLIDLVPVRSGLPGLARLPDRGVPGRRARGRARPVPGYANALRDSLSEAVQVLDAFHIGGLRALTTEVAPVPSTEDGWLAASAAADGRARHRAHAGTAAYARSFVSAWGSC